MHHDKATNSAFDDVWYLDFGASNHMTLHGELFDEMALRAHGYVYTGDDT